MRQNDLIDGNNLEAGAEIYGGDNLVVDIYDIEFGDELLTIDVDAVIALREIERVHCAEQQLKEFFVIGELSDDDFTSPDLVLWDSRSTL